MEMGRLIVESWLTDVDREIFYFFRAHDIAVKPATIARNASTERPKNSVRRRLWKLEEAGLVERNSTYVYQLTKTGRQLINDELSLSELEKLEPED